MIFEVDENLTKFRPIPHSSISDRFGENEKKLENIFKDRIGNDIFPELMVIGNERILQKEPDIFAVGENGELVLFELKVFGHYDRSKIYQAMEYAQIFSKWRYDEMNNHFKKCFPEYKGELLDQFVDHFGHQIHEAKFNSKQKIIVISNSSSLTTSSAAQYWKSRGVDIEEYFYRFYEIGDKKIFEISTELYTPSVSASCWVNTCEKFRQGAYHDMVLNSKASAYGDNVELIGEWMNRTHIFLYLNGWGIIAGGIGTNNIRYDESGELPEKYIKLKDFVHGVDLKDRGIDKFIPPRKIRELLGQNFWFPQTIVSLSKEMGEILYNECKQIFASKL